VPLGLDQHLALMAEEVSAANAAPLSQRKALLAAALIDAFADRVFYGRRGEVAGIVAEDLPAFRAALAAREPALGIIAGLCALKPEGPTLITTGWPVAPEETAALSQPDFMVSLYNGWMVQRVLLAWPNGRRQLAHPVLATGLGWWQAALSG
jgi:hypothetical protein